MTQSLMSPSVLRKDVSLRSSIHYQGRKAARAKSEQRRRLILEAALRIVAREGIRGVKHRAVAREAGVPLASTTYYFKDISELITDAFMLFAENSQRKFELFYGELHNCISKYDLDAVQTDRAMRRSLAEELIELGVRYVHAQVRFRRDELLSEKAFLLESLRDESLKMLARKYRAVWQAGLVDLLRSLKTPSPEMDAGIIMGTVANLVYNGLLYDGEIQEDILRSIWSRMIYLLMNI